MTGSSASIVAIGMHEDLVVDGVSDIETPGSRQESHQRLLHNGNPETALRR
jgi:hypothetical protein